MLNFKSWLEFVRDGIINNDERYQVIGDEHVLDVMSGIKLHIYDEWFKITHEDELIATMRDFHFSKEQPILWEIKQLLTDPEKLKDEKENSMKYIEERRLKLADLLQNPTPLGAITEGDEEYEG